MWSAAMDVGGWLRGLSLGEYEDNFRNNKIAADVLPQPTADDLRVAVGDRRRLLSAIRRFGRRNALRGRSYFPACAQRSSDPRRSAVQSR
jgi:hypothetical protein